MGLILGGKDKGEMGNCIREFVTRFFTVKSLKSGFTQKDSSIANLRIQYLAILNVTTF